MCRRGRLHAARQGSLSVLGAAPYGYRYVRRDQAGGTAQYQIVLEEAKGKNVLLPVPLLHTIIQYGDNVLGEFFEKYLEQTIKNYISYKAAFDEQFEKWLNLGTNLSQAGQKTMAGVTPFQAFFQQFSDSEETKEKDGHEK